MSDLQVTSVTQVGVIMITGIRQKTLVGENGKVEIPASDIPGGTLVDVIVLVEPVEE